MKTRGRRLLSAVYSCTLMVGGLWLGARLVALGYIHWTIGRFEAKYGSTDPYAYLPPRVRPFENGGRFYRAAAALVVTQVPGVDRLWERPLEIDDTEALRASVARSEPWLASAVALLDRGAGEPKCQLLQDGPRAWLEPQPVDPLALVRLAQYRLARARIAWLDGDSDGLLGGVLSSLALANCLEREPAKLLGLGLAIERQSLGLLEKVLAQSPRGDELRSRALVAALENLPPLDYAGQLLLDGVALAPRSSAWLYSSSAHDPWPSRVLALPALTRALILTEIEEGLDTLNSSEPPRGRLGWGLFHSQPDVPWRMQRKCEAQMALRSRVMAALTANMGPRHESDSISRPDR